MILYVGTENAVEEVGKCCILLFYF